MRCQIRSRKRPLRRPLRYLIGWATRRCSTVQRRHRIVQRQGPGDRRWLQRQPFQPLETTGGSSGDLAAARATAAGLRRVDRDRVVSAAAPGAAARRTQMRLDEGGSPDRTVTAGIG